MFLSDLHIVRIVSKTKKIQRFFFLPIFKDFSKTFESNQLSKNCECKQHFFFESNTH
jgi:hypothetical protein